MFDEQLENVAAGSSKDMHDATRQPLLILLPALLALLAYVNSLHGDFVMDDAAAIVKNMDLRSNVTTIGDVFRHDFWGTPINKEESHKSYRPLTVLT